MWTIWRGEDAREQTLNCLYPLPFSPRWQETKNYLRLSHLVGATLLQLDQLGAECLSRNVLCLLQIYNSSDLASLGGSLQTFTTFLSLPIIDTILPIWTEPDPPHTRDLITKCHQPRVSITFHHNINHVTSHQSHPSHHHNQLPVKQISLSLISQ